MNDVTDSFLPYGLLVRKTRSCACVYRRRDGADRRSRETRRPLRKRLRLRFRVPRAHAHAHARRENTRPDLGPRTIVTANIVIIHRNPPAVLAPADARFSQQQQSSLPPPVSSRSHGGGHVNANACASHRARASRKYSGFWYRYPDFIFIPSDLHFVRRRDRTRSTSHSLSSPHDSSTLTKFRSAIASNRIARSEVRLPSRLTISMMTIYLAERLKGYTDNWWTGYEFPRHLYITESSKLKFDRSLFIRFIQNWWHGICHGLIKRLLNHSLVITKQTKKKNISSENDRCIFLVSNKTT